MLNLFQHLTASLYLPPPFLGEILKQVQDDFWRFLLFLHSFWGSQFNTYVKSHRSRLITHYSKICRIRVISVPFSGTKWEDYLLVAPNSSEWEPKRTKLIASLSIQIKRKSPPIWHSMQPLYWPVSMCGRQLAGMGSSFARQRRISSSASNFSLCLA